MTLTVALSPLLVFVLPAGPQVCRARPVSLCSYLSPYTSKGPDTRSTELGRLPHMDKEETVGDKDQHLIIVS